MRKGIKGIRLSTEAMLIYDDRIWFAEADSNGIYSYDLRSHRSALECIIDKEPSNGKRLFRTMVICEGDLYVFPFSAQNAYKINLHTKAVKCIKIDEPPKNTYDRYSSNAKFLSSFLYGSKIFVVGVTYPAILEYDVKTGHIRYHNEWLSEMRGCFRNQERVLFRRAEMVMDKLYIPSGRGDLLLIFDMSTGKHEVCRIGDGKGGFSAVCYDGEDFWFAPLSEGAVVQWNENSRKCISYDCFPDGFVHADHGINDIVFWDDTVILLPGASNMFLGINRQTGVIFELNTRLRNFKLVSKCVRDDRLYTFSGTEDELVVFDHNIQCIKLLSIALPRDMEGNFESKEGIRESRVDTLLPFLRSRLEPSEGSGKEQTGGKELWKGIKESL